MSFTAIWNVMNMLYVGKGVSHMLKSTFVLQNLQKVRHVLKMKTCKWCFTSLFFFKYTISVSNEVWVWLKYAPGMEFWMTCENYSLKSITIWKCPGFKLILIRSMYDNERKNSTELVWDIKLALSVDCHYWSVTDSIWLLGDRGSGIQHWNQFPLSCINHNYS